MRSMIFIGVLSFLSFYSFGQTNISGVYTISGTVTVPFSGKVYLQYYDYALSKTTVDSAPVINQHYILRGSLQEPVSANLLFSPSDSSSDFRMNAVYFLFVEPGNIQVETARYMSQLKVSGSTLYNEYVDFQKKDRQYLQRIDSCRFQMAQANKKKDTLEYAKYAKAINIIQQEQLISFYGKEVLLKKNSMFSLFILQRMFQMKFEKGSLKSIFQQLTPRIRNTAAAKDFINRIS